MNLPIRDLTDVHARYRSALKLMTVLACKGRKGEDQGYLTATLYLMPHDSGGGANLCTYSTPACREMCLSGAGLSGLPRQLAAKQRRTDLLHADRQRFAVQLLRDITKLEKIAKAEGLKPAVRLNGTSDVLWERVAPALFDFHPDVQFYDYTKIPLRHREPRAPNYHLTYSMGETPESWRLAVEYLRAGHSVAVVVPEAVLKREMAWNDDGVIWAFLTGGSSEDPPLNINLIDGDEHDLRFLDPPTSLVMLKPKGRVATALIRPEPQLDLVKGALGRD